VEARKTFTESKQELEKLERELTAAHQSVEKLTGDFGPEAEWKKLEGTCIEKEQGE
jgi:protein kinase C substrate 80K-H